uniref:Copper chaperone CopZ n=1 Tax=Candidatus Kentrum sp. DK TaxID=2126562 RepID=A0A450T1I3_9GAMM|nr:MAG: Copper chaperone CopZ [Candidatus Kentron sp. DK]
MENTACKHPVERTIRVTGMTCGGCEQTIQKGLNALPGIHQVYADHRMGRVKVTYDLFVTQLQAVERKLSQLGYSPNDGFVPRIKRGWIHYTEQNRKDNLMHQGHCCGKPPPGA